LAFFLRKTAPHPVNVPLTGSKSRWHFTASSATSQGLKGRRALILLLSLGTAGRFRLPVPLWRALKKIAGFCSPPNLAIVTQSIRCGCPTPLWWQTVDLAFLRPGVVATGILQIVGRAVHESTEALTQMKGNISIGCDRSKRSRCTALKILPPRRFRTLPRLNCLSYSGDRRLPSLALDGRMKAAFYWYVFSIPSGKRKFLGSSSAPKLSDRCR